MRAALLLCCLVLSTLGGKVIGDSGITCSDFKNMAVVGSILKIFSSKTREDVGVDFFLSTREQRQPAELSIVNWSALQSSGFDPTKKTYIVIHGYKSGGRKSWVLDLKDKLLDARGGNVILVDWSQGSNVKNYINAARNTPFATDRIFNFLQTLRVQVERLSVNGPVMWNRLHFIGHSLGAQISAQTSNLLKENSFWKVERITGLDPAKPCFSGIDPRLKIDKSDADFVDIIHTQADDHGGFDSLGTKERVGHIDFYVNGGVAQPQCLGSRFTPKLTKMVCSHKLSYKYFAESLANAVNGSCKFNSHRWNGSYEEALEILNFKKNNVMCNDCPEMGINASKLDKQGTYLVLTSIDEPYCDFQREDEPKLLRVLKKLRGSARFDSVNSDTEDD
ncbi:pancreatic lipase-related protein 2-like [Trichogramma pretiosum]|uniref:pancreatic lipase-related protein 2-like n=1 Tax=Trichogramma pretiosum TaxID=7493 RepID=UPI0006C9D8FA|nr:pancreatic lipase-related protein 2-like [Trichogramma pretiosum]